MVDGFIGHYISSWENFRIVGWIIDVGPIEMFVKAINISKNY